MSMDKEFNIDLVNIDDIVISNSVIENNTEFSGLDKHRHFNITFNFTPGINLDRKKIRIIFSCSVETINDAGERIEINGKFEIAFYFNVKNIEQLTSGNGDNIQINAELLASLGNIAYATSRGIIYTKCQGTVFSKMILPVLSTEKLVEMLQPATE